MNRMLWSAIVLALAASCEGLVAAAPQDVGRRDPLQLFDERVTAYAELHERVAAVFPPWAPTDDVNLLVRRRTHLAFAIRAERLNVRQGDIFEPAVAVVVRDILARALNGVDQEGLLSDLYEDCEMPAGYRALVNAEYPDWATHAMPVVLLAALPALPAGIHYRLIDHDLLLWDTDADVIIDVLPDALPVAGS